MLYRAPSFWSVLSVGEEREKGRGYYHFLGAWGFALHPSLPWEWGNLPQ